MKLETFFEKFEQFADAPDAVAKMRELVLQLAVRGQLVPQNPQDEPAAKAIEMLVAHNGSKGAAKPFAEEVSTELPFEVPASWKWVRFGDIVRIRTGKLDANAAVEGGAYLFFTCSKTPSQIATYSFDTSAVILAGNGDFNLKSYSGKFDAYQRTYVIEPLGWELGFCFWLISAQIKRITDNQRGSAIPYLRFGDIADPLVPFPPLAEQKRIVAKVDELMALCDRLEAQQRERESRHAALARASLARFAEAPTPANLDFLFHQSYAITPADLRKSILTLAVQGKLVPQDPGDELGEKFLNAPKKAERNKPKWAGPIEEQEKPFQLPSSWMWFRLGDISSLKHGYAFSSEFFTSEPAPFVLTTPGNFYEKGGFRDRESKRKYYSGSVDPEFIFKPGDLIIPMTEQAEGLLGSPAFIPDDGRVYIHNQRLGKLSFSEAIAPEFAFWFFNCEFFRGELSRTCTGMKVRHTSPDRILKVPFPVCSLAEQHRIVAKVDQLMALVDQLESQLAEAKSKNAALLEAVVHELLNPSAEVIDLASYRAFIGCYTIRKMSDKPYFGRTAAMKMFYLAQAHVGMKLELQPEREAAGPLDQWIYRFEDEGQRQGWFKAIENKSNGKRKVEYQPGKMLAEQAAQGENMLSPEQRKEFDRLLDLLSDKKTEEVEIIATLFAAWNDFLIDGHAPSDDEIVTEVREHWHVKKERFTPVVLRHWLGWLRQNNLAPQGRSPHTVYQSQLLN